MEVIWHDAVRYYYNFVEVIFGLVGHTPKSVTIYAKNLLSGFGVGRRRQIISQIAKKDFIILFIVEDDFIFNSTIVDMAIDAFSIRPGQVLGGHT